MATLCLVTAPSWHGARPGRRGLVVAWMPVSQRSRTLAERLGFELHLLGRPGFRRPWSAAMTYPLLAWRTIRIVLAARPVAIVVVAPPFVAALIGVTLARVLHAKVAVDIHSGALVDRRWRWSIPVLRWTVNRADAGVVTLASLAGHLGSDPAPIVLPDPLPTIPVEDLSAIDAPRPEGHRRRVVAICGWGDDEPIQELVGAANGAPWELVVTGRPRRAIDAPPNVRLAGFLDDAEYAATLAAADAVVVLTTREDTLLSGAWEALAVGRPLIVSATRSLQDTFGDAVVYTDNDAGSIRRACDALLADTGALPRAGRARATWAGRTDTALAVLRARLDVG